MGGGTGHQQRLPAEYSFQTSLQSKADESNLDWKSHHGCQELLNLVLREDIEDGQRGHLVWRCLIAHLMAAEIQASCVGPGYVHLWSVCDWRRRIWQRLPEHQVFVL